MSVTLFIDTSKTHAAKVAIERNGKRFEETSQSKVTKSQAVLPLIEKLLREHKLQLGDIHEIVVAEGPGSFTGLRVGATIANALGDMLDIPVNGKKALAIPKY